MVDAKGDSLTRAETVTLFNDLCCLSSGALLSPDITWEPIDNHAATAHFTPGVNTVAAERRFDDSGGLGGLRGRRPWRDFRGWQLIHANALVKVMARYAQVGPARVATKTVVKWHPDSGAWTYGAFALTSLAYYEANRPASRPRSGPAADRSPQSDSMTCP